MAANQRIFYATHSVSIGNGALLGVQSVTLNSNFNLEPVFQLGQLTHVELYPNNPSVEATITRALVGGNLAYNITVRDSDVAGVETKLQTPTQIIIGNNVGGGFTIPEAFISSYTANFSTDGLFTEELSYVGEALNASGGLSPSSSNNNHASRRLDFSISGADAALADGITSASFSVNFNRENVYRLGAFIPHLRTVTFPIEATLQYSVLVPKGAISSTIPAGSCSPINAPEKSITITACGSQTWRINKARLTSVNYSGGDTGGGNVEVQYTYTSYNDFSIGSGG